MSLKHAASVQAEPTIERLSEASLGDLRFRTLLGLEGWETLNSAIRGRFSKRLANGNTVVFVGQVREIWMSPVGSLLAQAARLIGGPFPIGRDVDVPSLVTVTEDMATGGQIWTRVYTRRNGFPQVIHSSKRFAGPTGLEEHVGFGVGMALTVHAAPDTLVFRSAGYFIRVLGWRLPLPDWATPGALTVTHADCADGSFIFTLELVHPRFGALIRQSAVYRET
jgi:hypothetical protein